MLTTRAEADRAISNCPKSFAATAAPARAATSGRRRAGLCPLLASTSLAALLIGVGTPAAFAQCTPGINLSGASETTVTNLANPIQCISITNGTTVAGNVTNEPNGVITPGGPISPVLNRVVGILIDNSSIGGTVVNAGAITVTGNSAAAPSGIFITNNATVSSGISNSGTISAPFRGITVGTTTTFGGGISNSGLITTQGASSGTAAFSS